MDVRRGKDPGRGSVAHVFYTSRQPGSSVLSVSKTKLTMSMPAPAPKADSDGIEINWSNGKVCTIEQRNRTHDTESSLVNVGQVRSIKRVDSCAAHGEGYGAEHRGHVLELEEGQVGVVLKRYSQLRASM